MKRPITSPAFLARVRALRSEKSLALPPNQIPPELEQSAEKLLSTANDGTVNARNIYLTLLGFCLFLSLVTGGLTDEKLLLDNAVALPLVEKVDLPLSVFYAVAPWLLVFLHGDLLLNFALLAEKLHRFRQAIAEIEEAPNGVNAADRFRHRLSNFPFTHWIAGDSDYHFVQSIIVWSTVFVLPPVVLLGAQIGFLPYHSESIVWVQRLALVTDIALIIAFWPSFQGMDRGRGWWLWWWRAVLRLPNNRIWYAPWPWFPKKSMHEGGATRLLVLSSCTLFISFFVATFPGETLEERVTLKIFGEPIDPSALLFSTTTKKKSCPQVYFCGAGKHGWKVAREYFDEEQVPEKEYCDTHGDKSDPDILVRLSGKQLVTCLTALTFHRKNWPGWHRNLELDERALDVRGPLKPDVVAQLRSEDSTKRRVALDGVDPLDLRRRNLSHAQLIGTVFPKVDLRGADLSYIRANNAIWPQARGDEQTRLSGARLTQSDLQGGNFNQTHLDGAVLEDAKLQGSQLAWSKLGGANLTRANLQGADLVMANLQESKLSETRLQGADLTMANFGRAVLTNTHLQGADLTLAGSFIQAKLEGTELFGAILTGTDFEQATIVDLKRPMHPPCIGNSKICGAEGQTRDTNAKLHSMYEELLCRTGDSIESIAIASRMLNQMSNQMTDDPMSDQYYSLAPPSDGFNTQADALARALSIKGCEVYARLSSPQRRTLQRWIKSRSIDTRH